MATLKPEVAFFTFQINTQCPTFNRFDPTKLADLLVSDYRASRINHLAIADYNDKPIYQKLPRCLIYYMSEYQYTNLVFEFDSFIVDYSDGKHSTKYLFIKEFLKRYPEHKKALRLKKKYEKEYTEWLI